MLAAIIFKRVDCFCWFWVFLLRKLASAMAGVPVFIEHTGGNKILERVGKVLGPPSGGW